MTEEEKLALDAAGRIRERLWNLAHENLDRSLAERLLAGDDPACRSNRDRFRTRLAAGGAVAAYGSCPGGGLFAATA